MSGMTKFLKVIIGLVLIVLGVLSYAWWYPALWVLFKGALGLVVILLGLLVILVAFTE